MAELTISAADIEGAVEEYVSSFSADTEREEIGTVIDAGDGIAHVDAAAELTDAQRDRLAELLTRIYGHPVAVQLNVDPEVLGGLSITVGDEVIDGSIASRLAAAQTQLPD